MKILRFDEANLNFDELSKLSPDKTNVRGDILIQKLADHEDLSFRPRNGEPKNMPVSNGEEIVDGISVDGEYNRDKATTFLRRGTRYKPVFKGEDGDIYNLNDIEKTKDFGSSGGSSLGSKGTSDAECLQCIFLAVRQELKREISESDVDIIDSSTGQIKSEYLKYVRLPEKFIINQSSLEEYLYDKDWINTLIKIANAMYDDTPVFTKEKETYEKVLKSDRNYLFFHNSKNSGIIETLARKYRELKPIGSKIPLSKWSPADLWAISENNYKNIIPLIEECTTFSKFNSVVNELFTSNDLRGISLKKVSDNNERITIVINRLTPVPKYKFNNVIISDNPFSNIGIRVTAKRSSDYLDSGLEKIGFRSFGGSTICDISGEVEGESARHGKVGLLKVNHFIGLINKEFTFDDGEIPEIPIKNSITMNDTILRREIERLNEKVKIHGAEVSRTRTRIFSSRSGLVSKYQSLMIADFLYEYSLQPLTDKQSVSDMLLENILHYAMSIKNDEFDCPKYVRIL